MRNPEVTQVRSMGIPRLRLFTLANGPHGHMGPPWFTRAAHELLMGVFRSPSIRQRVV